MTLVAGVDSSTQSTKVEIRDIESGRLIASAKRSHPPTSPPVSEQDPSDWWRALVGCFGELAPHLRQVRAVSVAAQQHGLVMLDHLGVPVRPAKLWNDTTSAPQAQALVERLGAHRWAAMTGSVPLAAFTISKLAWVVDNEPDAVSRCASLMLPHDYLVYSMTGTAVTDRGDASGTGWFDPATDTYRPEVFELAGCPQLAQAVPSVSRPFEAVGEVTAPELVELGLGGAVVGPGTGDNMAAALGLGLEAGDLVISLGTSGTVYARSGTATADPSGLVAGFADAAGGFLPLVCTLNATKVTDSVATWLGVDAAALAELALEAVGDTEVPVLVPYFDGERTPNLPAATGSLLGLGTSTTRAQLALGAHDGVLCGLLGGADALRAAGVTIEGRCYLVGGGARSQAYRRRAADLRNDSVVVPHQDEVVATGAAVQAAVVVSGSDLGDVARRWGLGSGTTVEPTVDATATVHRYHQAAGLHLNR
ncbi:MAG: xylulokinase [Acidimicrobiales bacterium]